MAADRMFDRLKRHEAWCKINGGVLAARLEGESGRRPAAFRLRFDSFEESGAMIVVDDDNRARFRFE
jgi:hypothetical protein